MMVGATGVVRYCTGVGAGIFNGILVLPLVIVIGCGTEAESGEEEDAGGTVFTVIGLEDVAGLILIAGGGR